MENLKDRQLGDRIPFDVNVQDEQRVLQQPRIASCQVPYGNAIPHQEPAVLHHLGTHLVPTRFRQQCRSTSYISRHKPTQQNLLTVISDEEVPGIAMRQQK
jgi:hypothetical protein